jgi:Resolvase, N terminal domain/Recombinase
VIAAFSYKRFSSSGQINNDSFDRQEGVARDWYNREIAPLGIPLDESFTDSARSAYNGEHVGKRGDLGRFVAAIKSGVVSKGSILIAENLDRISRQGPKIARELFKEIVDKGVDVHIVNIATKLTYGWENHPRYSVIVDLELDRAFKESERRSQLISSGLTAVKHSDGWAGILPFWLQKVYEPGSAPISNGKKAEKPKYTIVEIPEKAELVREIFRLATNGLGSKRILQDLHSRGFECSISLGTVGELLRNRAVLGEHQPLQYLETGPVADGDPVLKFPRIVDQTDFDIVAVRLDSKMKVCADGKVRPATGNRYSHEANNLFEALLRDVTEAPERSMTFQKKGEWANPYLISKWEPGRKSNRVRYDLFEHEFLHYLRDEVDWKAVAGEKETGALKQARHELNCVRAERDQASHLLARRSKQALDPSLLDAVVAVYNGQIADATARIATLTEQQHHLEGLIALESMKAEALYSPERLIKMIRDGDPAMRLSLRAELRRVISRIELDFDINPDGLTVTVRFINDATRTVVFLKLMPRRSALRLAHATRAAETQ